MNLRVYKKTYVNTNNLDHCLSSVYVFLLQVFNDIFSNEIPSGLSPIRGSKHQIDPIPRAFIPN
jgi:hypothetical protein